MVNIDDNFLMKMAEISESATGAIIENIVNEAATRCFSKEKDFIDREELEDVCAKSINEFKKFKKYELFNVWDIIK